MQKSEADMVGLADARRFDVIDTDKGHPFGRRYLFAVVLGYPSEPIFHHRGGSAHTNDRAPRRGVRCPVGYGALHRWLGGSRSARLVGDVERR